MNIWEVSMSNVNWANPFQKIMVATESMDIEDAVRVANATLSGLVSEVKHIGFAHLTKEDKPHA
jgi:hypothetical protein